MSVERHTEQWLKWKGLKEKKQDVDESYEVNIPVTVGQMLLVSGFGGSGVCLSLVVVISVVMDCQSHIWSQLPRRFCFSPSPPFHWWSPGHVSREVTGLFPPSLSITPDRPSVVLFPPSV